MDEARQSAQKLLEHVQQRKDNRKAMEIKEGNWVWLEGQNLSIQGNKKLSLKRYGPYRVIKQIGATSFKLNLPVSMHIHDVFHADLLLPYKEMEAYRTPFTCPPPIIDNEEEYEIESILKVRKKKHSNQKEYLMHWRGYPHSDDSWVSQKDLHAPDLLKEFNSTTAGQAYV
jgi:Chromo (CHRromatin Organisation MOdifier) domain